MGKCERCGVELYRGDPGWPIEIVNNEYGDPHTDARCADRLKTQRDEALAKLNICRGSACVLEKDDERARVALDALRAELARMERDATREHMHDVQAQASRLRAELERKDAVLVSEEVHRAQDAAELLACKARLRGLGVVLEDVRSWFAPKKQRLMETFGFPHALNEQIDAALAPAEQREKASEALIRAQFRAQLAEARAERDRWRDSHAKLLDRVGHNPERCADMPALEASHAALRAELARKTEALRAVEYVEGFCPICKRAPPRNDPGWGTGLRGHDPCCQLAAALAEPQAGGETKP